MKKMFKQIPGFQDYLVNKLGDVWSIKRNKLLTPTFNTSRYLQVSLCVNGKRYTRKVHQLVALTYLNRKPTQNQVNHKDANKTNNHVENLEWCTYKENRKHAIDLGLFGFGENGCGSKLNDEKVKSIRNEYIKGVFGVKKLAKKYNISFGHVWKIVTGKKWKHLL